MHNLTPDLMTHISDESIGAYKSVSILFFQKGKARRKILGCPR
jgi:hypothetical protein